MFATNMIMDQFYDEMLAEFSSNLISYMMAIAGYILLSLGMYAIAKRRGISKPWLAWVPFGQSWMLGCISDQFQYVTMGREKSKRKVLLWLEVLISVLAVVICVMLAWVLWNSFWNVIVNQIVTEQDVQQRVMEAGMQLMGILLLSLAMLGLAITFAVVKYIALYDLYRSCDPEKATLFTLLSIFLGALAVGIVVLLCRDKDFGMPPRRDQTPYGEAVYQLPQQTWQEPQPPKEPWEQ